MKEITDLQPQLVWKYFNDILQIPRPSKKEEKIMAYLEGFAKENNLEYKKDKIGNILILKPASKGKEKMKTVVFQSHVDMVCEKNSGVIHNFDTDPIKAYIDGEWLRAKGTTLGADNGIGVATQLAVLADKSIQHGPIECLFTVDEETGLTGANKLEKGFLKAEILINLDSEDEGEIYIGCAGGVDTLISYPLKYCKTPKQHTTYQIIISGLKGGHSGDDINKGLGNSNKILTRILWSAYNAFELTIADFHGGNLRNAIPREASAIVTVQTSHIDKFLNLVKSIELSVKNELQHTEPDLNIEAKPIEQIKQVLEDKYAKQLLNSLYACPNGVIAMSQTVPGLVETSTNLASVHFKEDLTAEIVTSQRSSVETAKIDVANSIESTFKLIDAKIWHSDSYPGWTPNTDSDILRISEKSYESLFSVKPDVKAIHAGLECGLILEKYPHLDMVSIGPTLRGVHSPDERMHIESVDKFWKFLLKILEEIPEK
jgi:dipeptidase D